MCGIVGLFSSTGSTNAVAKKRFFHQGLVTGWLRGENATGLFGVPDSTKNFSPEVIRRCVRGHDFADLDIVDRYLQNVDTFKASVGHHRAATLGGRNQGDAHPFRFGNTTLVHNGTLSNHHYFDHKDSTISSVDSAKLAYNLSKEKDPLDVLTRVNGAFALVWYNEDTKKLYFTRNDDRPLHFAWDKNNTNLYFASEKEHLQWLLVRNKLSFEKVYKLKTNVLHVVDIRKEGIHVDGIKWKKSANPYKSEFGVRRNQGGGYTNRGYGQNSHYYDDYEQSADGSWHPRNAKFPLAPPLKTNTLPILTDARTKVIDAELADLNTTYGAEVIAWPTKFIPYSGNQAVHGSGVFSIRNGDEAPDYVVSSLVKDHFDIIGKKGHYAHLLVRNSTIMSKKKVVICDIQWAKTREHWKLLVENDSDKPKKGEVIPIKTYVPGPGESLLGYKDFLTAVEDGCVACDGPIRLDEAEETNWLEGKPVCATCWTDQDFWEEWCSVHNM
jgi:hypothetical protein